MKIIDIAEFYSPQGGGVRTYIHHKLEASARLGHQTVIIAPGPHDREEVRRGGKIIWVKAPRLPLDRRYHLFRNMAGAHHILDREAPDVVEGSSPWMGGWIAACWPGPAVKSFFFHQDPVASYPQTFLGPLFGARGVDRLFSWFWAYLRKLTARFDTSIVSGEWLASRMENFGLRRPQAIPLGIDRKNFSPILRNRAERRRMLAACGLDCEDAALFVTVSRHHPEKHLGTLIDAFEKASRRQPMGFFLIGDGPSRRWVERRAARTPGVYVAGAVTDRQVLARYLASADAMLHGCASETFGIVIAEALCSGLPLVVPNVGGAAELAAADYAETYPAGNADACAEAIARLLAQTRAPLGAAAVKAAQSRVHSPEDHFRALFAHYERLIEQQRPPLAATG